MDMLSIHQEIVARMKATSFCDETPSVSLAVRSAQRVQNKTRRGKEVSKIGARKDEGVGKEKVHPTVARIARARTKSTTKKDGENNGVPSTNGIKRGKASILWFCFTGNVQTKSSALDRVLRTTKCHALEEIKGGKRRLHSAQWTAKKLLALQSAMVSKRKRRQGHSREASYKMEKC